MATEAEEMREIFEQLPPAQRQDLLRYAYSLADGVKNQRKPLQPGTSGHVLHGLSLPSDLVDEMMRAINEDCERHAITILR